MILPTFADGAGTQVNISGAAIAKHAPNKANAVKLLEYLVSDEAQEIYAKANFEYPVKPGIAADPIIAELGTLKPEPMLAHRDLRPSQGSERTGRQGRLRRLGATQRIEMTIANRHRTSRTPRLAAVRRRVRLAGGVGVTALLVLAPVVALVFIAGQGSGDVWPHLVADVLPSALADTAILLVGVGDRRRRHRHRHGVAGLGL